MFQCVTITRFTSVVWFIYYISTDGGGVVDTASECAHD